MSVAPVGEMIGNVRLDTLLKEGIISVAYRGYHTTLNIDVVVKMLRPERQQTQQDFYEEYFRREARMAAKLDEHPNIVRVLDFGQHQTLPYIVMELIDGYSLQAYINKRAEPFDDAGVLKIVWTIANALDSLHALGIVHRDLKPANLFISRKGQLKISSLGFAHNETTASPGSRETLLASHVRLIPLFDVMHTPPVKLGTLSLHAPQLLGGSPAYMAPECFRPDGYPDARSDIYALGTIAYQMIFGHLPYTGDVLQVINGHLSGTANFDLPSRCQPETLALVQAMMAPDCEARPQDAKTIIMATRTLLRAFTHNTARTPGASHETLHPAETRQTMLADVAQSMERRFSDIPPLPEQATKSGIIYVTRRMVEKLFDPLATREEKKPLS